MTATYEPISTQTIGTAVASVTFSSIPQTYTDLILVQNAAAASGNPNNYIQFNGDTASNYSRTTLRGTGSVASSGRLSNQTFIYTTSASGTTTTSLAYNSFIHIMNYKNATTFKTVLVRSNNAGTGTEAIVGLWRKTPEAITSVTVTSESVNFTVGSTFTLYGIKAA